MILPFYLLFRTCSKPIYFSFYDIKRKYFPREGYSQFSFCYLSSTILFFPSLYFLFHYFYFLYSSSFFFFLHFVFSYLITFSYEIISRSNFFEWIGRQFLLFRFKFEFKGAFWIKIVDFISRSFMKRFKGC